MTNNPLASGPSTTDPKRLNKSNMKRKPFLDKNRNWKMKRTKKK